MSAPKKNRYERESDVHGQTVWLETPQPLYPGSPLIVYGGTRQSLAVLAAQEASDPAHQSHTQ